MKNTLSVLILFVAVIHIPVCNLAFDKRKPPPGSFMHVSTDSSGNQRVFINGREQLKGDTTPRTRIEDTRWGQPMGTHYWIEEPPE